MTTVTKTGVLLALTMLAACGGVEPAPIADPMPRPAEPDETKDDERDIAVSGFVELVDGRARVNLDVTVDGAFVTDAQVSLSGEPVAFDAAQAGYVAQLSAALADESLALVVVHGTTTHSRTLVVPGAFEVQAPVSVVLETDFRVEWSAAAKASLYRIQLQPGDGVVRGGGLSANTRAYTFNGLLAPGTAALRVIAVTTNREADERSAIEVLRTDDRAVTFVQPPPPEHVPEFVVSGRIMIADGAAEANLDVWIDGEYVYDATVTLGDRVLPFVQDARGYFAELDPAANSGAEPLSLEVVHGDLTHTRTIVVPGAFAVEAPASVAVGSNFVLRWNAVENVTGCRISYRMPSGHWGSSEMVPSVRKHTIGGTGAAGEVSIRATAVTVNSGEAPHSEVEVHRVEILTVAIVE